MKRDKVVILISINGTATLDNKYNNPMPILMAGTRTTEVSHDAYWL